MNRFVSVIAVATLGLLCLGATPTAEEAYDDARKAQVQALRRGTPEAWSRAALSFEGFVAQYPQHRLATEARFGRAECLLAAGELDAAWAAYQDLRDRGPGKRLGDVLGGEAFVLLARMEAGEPTGAALLDRVGELRHAEPLHDRLPPLLLAAAGVHRGLGEYRSAEAALLAVIADWPADPIAARAWEELGAVRFEQEDWEGAVEAYRGYVDRFPDGDRIAEIRCLIAYAQLERGALGDAAIAAEYLLQRLHPDREPSHARLWTETVKILAAARAREIRDIDDFTRGVTHLDHPWSLDTLVAVLAVHAAEDDPGLALQGLDVLSRRQMLELDKASDGLLEQLVSCCFALRDARPDSADVHQWLLVAADALDALERPGDAGEVLQWLRNHADDPAVRREAREKQVRAPEKTTWN